MHRRRQILIADKDFIQLSKNLKQILKDWSKNIMHNWNSGNTIHGVNTKQDYML